MDTLHGTDSDPTSAVHIFASDDFFGASRLLVLDHLLERSAAGTMTQVSFPGREGGATIRVEGPVEEAFDKIGLLD